VFRVECLVGGEYIDFEDVRTENGVRQRHNLPLTVLFMPSMLDSGRNIDTLIDSVCDFEESKSRESTRGGDYLN